MWDPTSKRLLLTSAKDFGQPTLWAWGGSAWIQQSEVTWPTDERGRWIDGAVPVVTNGAVQFFAVTESHELVQFRLGETTVRTLGSITGYVSFAVAEPSGTAIVHVALVGENGRGTTYRVAGDSARRLSVGPELARAAWDPATQRVIAVQDGALVALEAEQWVPVRGALAEATDVQGLVSDDDSVVVLERHQRERRVRVRTPDRWEEPIVVSPDSDGMGHIPILIGVDRVRDQLVAIRERTTWVSNANGPFRSVDSPWDSDLSFLPEFLQQESRLLLVPHATTYVATANGWQTVAANEGSPVAAAPSELFSSEKLGLVRLRAGGRWTTLIDARTGSVAPDGRYYSSDAPFGYDPQTRRVVVFMPIQGSNETWIAGDRSWTQLADTERPNADVPQLASMVTTPKALYLIAGTELWVFARDHWRRVGRDPTWLGMRTLRFDPTREILLSVGHHANEPFAIGVFDGTRWQVVEPLPSELAPPDDSDRLDDRGDISATWSVDGSADRAMVVMPDGSFRTLALGAYALPMHRLPN